MNILRSLFGDGFAQLVESTKEIDLNNGRVFLLMLRDITQNELLNLPPNVRLSLDDGIAKASTSPSDEGRENWTLIQRIMKVAGYNMEPFITKFVNTKRSVELQIFLYEFFNIYRRLKDASTGLGTATKGPNPQIDLHSGVSSIDQCTQLFEKLVYLVSKAAKVRLLEVN